MSFPNDNILTDTAADTSKILEIQPDCQLVNLYRLSYIAIFTLLIPLIAKPAKKSAMERTLGE